LIIIPRPPGPVVHRPPKPFPLEVKYHRVEVDINNHIAKTSIDQEFYNPSRMRLEGFYIFPLPKGAVFSNFSMSINGKMVSAELLNAKKARKIYEDIVRKMRDPALLEYSGTGAFKVRIYPIEPHSYKRVKISYTEVLKTDSGMTAYTYPLNTEKFSAKPLKDVSVRINLKSKREIKTIFCPTHAVEIKRHGEYRAVIGFEDRNVKPDTDFTLYYGTDKSEIGLNILTHRILGKDGFFFLAVTPSFSSGEKNIVPKDITFVVDTSGSMAGKKMKQAKQSLIFCMENLNSRDRFEIIRFSTEAETLFGKLQSSTPANVKKAKQFIENLKPIGGTNIEEALETALKVNSAGNSNRPAIVVFITDGKPTIGTTDENLLIKKVQQANSSNTRIFTFGIGNTINTHLLDRITEETKAYRTYVQPDEDIELKISAFYEKIKSPVLVNLKLNFGKGVKVSRVYPKELPDLFKGSQLIVFGRYNGIGKTTGILKGTMRGKQEAFRYTVNFPAENAGNNEFIAPLWAAQRIGYLLDQIRLNGENKELKDEIVTLARQYGIVTPYTSYLIVEDEKIRGARRELNEEYSTLSPSSRIDASFGKKLKDEFDSMHNKSGPAGVTASEEVQELKNVRNYKQIYQGQARLNYTDKEGRVQNLASQVKNIQGRAVYQTGKFWVDSKTQTLKNQKAKRIQFASSEFFTLLKKEPASAQFMALGQNIRFVLNNTIYEIFEKKIVL